MDYYGATLEVKQVDMGQRIIIGLAAHHENLDRTKDIIDQQASVKAVQRIGSMADVGVFIGHDTSALPVGIPLRIQATAAGLLTETKIKPGPVGDDLLETARFLHENGQSLGMSIGYYTKASKPDRVEGKAVRRILDYQLIEYSFAASQSIANPKALVTSVKSRKAMSEGTDGAGGMLVPADQKNNGTDGPLPCPACAALGNGAYNTPGCSCANCTAGSGDCQCEAAWNGMGDDDEEDGKTASSASEAKAVWTDKYVNTLPDSSFLYIAPGGVKDSEGKTIPREHRCFPYKDAGGTIDLPHLRNAIARIPQSNAEGLDDAKKASLQARARKLLEDASSGKTIDESAESQTGLAPVVRSLGYALVDLADDLVGELKAMHLLGEETKGCMRTREPQRDRLRALAAELKNLADVSEMIDRGVDGVARNQRYLALLELNAI